MPPKPKVNASGGEPAGGESHHRHVIASRAARLEVAFLARRQHSQRARRIHRVERHDLRQHRPVLPREFQLIEQFDVAQGGSRLCLVDDVAKLTCAQQRHRGHGDHAGLDHRQPRERHRNRVATAQQHSAAGHELHVFDEHAADAIHAVTHIVVAERDAAGPQQRPRAETFLRRLVEQLFNRVELWRELQLGQVEAQLRHLVCRRHAIADKRVGMCAHAAASAPVAA